MANNDKQTLREGHHPQAIAAFEALNDADIPWGLFSGRVVQQYYPPRPVDDYDVLIHPHDFDRVADILLPSKRQQRRQEVDCGDGHTLVFDTEEMTVDVGDTVIQIMRPGPIECNNGTNYHIAMTGLAAANRRVVEMGGVKVQLTHIFDTMAAKAIMQRESQGKRDAYDMRLLASAVDLSQQDPYVIARAQEIGLDERTWDFLTPHLGSLALQV